MLIEAIQEGEDIGVIGRPFKAYKSSEEQRFKPETIGTRSEHSKTSLCKFKRGIILPKSGEGGSVRIK